MQKRVSNPSASVTPYVRKKILARGCKTTLLTAVRQSVTAKIFSIDRATKRRTRGYKAERHAFSCTLRIEYRSRLDTGDYHFANAQSEVGRER